MKRKRNTSRSWFGLASASRQKGARHGRYLAHLILSFVAVLLWYLGSALLWTIVSLGKLIRPILGHIYWRLVMKKNAAPAEPPATGNGDLAIQNDSEFQPVTLEQQITFEQVVGLERAKKQIIERMILPFCHQKLSQLFGVPAGGGILLIGPPGNGKTFFAKAVACQIRAAFFYLKASDIITGNVGSSEAKIERLFKVIRSYPRSVLLIDEVEAILKDRDTNTSTIMERVIMQFLNELDGLQSRETKNSFLLIAATNKPWKVDMAFRRPGRLDVAVFVGLPDQRARAEILERQLENLPVADQLQIGMISRETEGFSCADLTELVRTVSRQVLGKNIREDRSEKDVRPIETEDFLSALQERKPTLKPEDLAPYYRFCEKYQIPTD